MLHTPDVALTLISVGCISDTGYSILFKDGMCTIHDGKNAIMGKFPSGMAYTKLTGMDTRQHLLIQ